MSNVISGISLIVGSIGAIMFIGSFLYATNRWNRWRKEFGKGNANLKNFKLAVKWSFFTLIGLILLFVGVGGMNNSKPKNQL